MALTSKQEKFCQGIVSGLNQSDSYRAAYNVSEDTRPESVNQMAWDLMQNVDITCRIEALRLPIAERIGMGLETYLTQLMEMRDRAKDDTPAIKAHELIGKCLGYYVNKTEISGSLSLEQMSDEELDKKLDEKLSRVKKS